jgi:4-carboxymuconolactone decarboxylase
VNAAVASIAAVFADVTNRVLFGDLSQRPDLSARNRSLITMTALIDRSAGAIGLPCNRAMDKV